MLVGFTLNMADFERKSAIGRRGGAAARARQDNVSREAQVPM